MILLLSGSPAPDSANSKLLFALGRMSEKPSAFAGYLPELPVFQPYGEDAQLPLPVVRLRKDAGEATAVIISTPAYLHNVPAVLKNALEWLTTTGELHGKPVLVFTFTPGAPRGDRARQSLLWSLEALHARVVAEQALYQPEVALTPEGDIGNPDSRELLEEALRLLP